VSVLPAATGQTANTGPTDPIRVPKSPPVADENEIGEPLIAPAPEGAVKSRFADQSNTTRLVSNLVAGLARTVLSEGQSNTPVGGAKSTAGNGFDLRGSETEREPNFIPQSRLTGLASEVSFATTVRDLQAGGGASSIQSQTISQIIAQAELLPGRQMRSFRLRLRPEELGEIDIQLSRDAAGRISAHISAERESARGTLSRSVDELRETLSRAGLTVDKLLISTETGLSAGHRGTEDARSHPRKSPSGVTNLLTENETNAGGQPRAKDEKLLSLQA
jgi:flagellar hook-length control protein FliK